MTGYEVASGEIIKTGLVVVVIVYFLIRWAIKIINKGRQD